MFQKCLCKLPIKCPVVCDVAFWPNILEHKVHAGQQIFIRITKFLTRCSVTFYSWIKGLFGMPFFGTVINIFRSRLYIDVGRTPSKIVCLPEFSNT